MASHKILLPICLMILVSFVQSEALKEHSHDPLVRVRRAHSGSLSQPSNSQRNSLLKVINKWSFPYAEERGHARTILEEGEARIDLQGISKNRELDRYNAQIGGKSYAAVHIERGYRMGVALIRQSFRESIEHQAHVFLTGPEISRINFPDDGFRYESRDIIRKWNKRRHVVRVWSTKPVVDALYREFNKVSI